MNRRMPVSVALAITIIAMTVTFSITWIMSMQMFDERVSAVTQLQAQYTKLAEIDNYVRANYYGEIDDDYLFDRVAVGYMAGLADRYSVYYTEQEYNNLQAIENGTRVGIGVELVRDGDGSFRIVRVYEGSPAEKAGVQPHGIIVSIDGNEAKNYQTAAAVRTALYGNTETELALVCRYGVTDEVTHKVRRTNYSAPTVESQVVDGYAYIRISAFTANTRSEFDYALRLALASEVQALVFDVRNNAGGLFRNSYDIIDQLCPVGTIAKRVNKAGTVQVLATSDDAAVHLPMVVLVNDGTSAAAELFAISLKDLAGAQVVGNRTAGRGTIQQAPYRLSDGSAVVVTSALLVTGRDESFNNTGIAPTIEIDGTDVTTEMLLNPSPGMDPQILRAIEVARSMVRNAGGSTGGNTPAPVASAGSSVAPQASSDISAPEETGASGVEAGSDVSESGDDSGSDSSTAASDDD